MTSTPGEPFDFLNPLDSQTYTLPPFDKSLQVDAVAAREDELPPIPTMYEALTSGTRQDFENALQARQEALGWLSTQGMLQTFDAHLPDADDATKAAIIANVNANNFQWLWEIYAKWVKASGEVVDSEQGEG